MKTLDELRAELNYAIAVYDNAVNSDNAARKSYDLTLRGAISVHAARDARDAARDAYLEKLKEIENEND